MMTEEELYKRYLGLIIEPATKYYEYFATFIKKKFAPYIKKTSKRKIKFTEEMAFHLLIECLIYSLAITERLSYNKTNNKMRMQAMAECVRKFFPDIIEYNFKKVKINKDEFENTFWHRYEEYGALLTNKQKNYQLIFRPSGATKELNDPIFRSTSRFIGVISCLTNENYNEIPGIEPGPVYLKDVFEQTILTEIFVDFLNGTISGVLMPAISKLIFEK